MPPRAIRDRLSAVRDRLSAVGRRLGAALRPLTQERWLLAGVLLVALGLRLVNIATEPYWSDEILSLDIATRLPTLGTVVRYLAAVEFHPPLYYALLRGWVRLFGETPLATRWLSVLASLGVVAMGWLIGRRVLPRTRAGLAAAATLAVLPMQLEYGQEARPYMLYCLTTAVALYALVRLLELPPTEPRRVAKWAALYAGATLTGMYLHYSAAYGAVALGAWWLGECALQTPEKRWPALKIWGSAHAAMAFGYLPWLGALLYKLALGSFAIAGHLRYASPMRRPDLLSAGLDMLVWPTKEKEVTQLALLGVAIAKFAFGAAALALLARAARRGGTASFWRPGPPPAARTLAALAAVSFAIPMLWLLSPQSQPYTNLDERHILAATVPLALLVGAVLARLPRRSAAMLFAVGFASLIPYMVPILGDDSSFDFTFRYAEAGEFITAQRRPGDLVITPISIRSDLNHYLPDDLPAVSLLPLDYFGNDVWATRHTLGLIENEAQVRMVEPNQAEAFLKMDQLVAKYHARRVWLYGFSEGDIYVRRWFKDGEWRHVYQPVGDVYRLDLYARR